MAWYSQKWAPYVSVEQRRRNAEREVAKLRRASQTITPVQLAGRAIATTVWGKAWCKHLEACQDYENRLPRGRSYVRNGAVIDLQIAPRTVTALVSGSDIYRVKVEIGAVPETEWQAIRADCWNRIESLIELLQGRLSKEVMERLCRQEQGLFPRPSEIRFSCSCPDHAAMCKHVAAALYGVGAKLDTMPELLFRLRDVDEAQLIAEAGTAVPGTAVPGAAGAVPDRILDDADVAALFGIDIATPAIGKEEATPRQDARGVRKSPPQKTAGARERRAVSARKIKRRAEACTSSVKPAKTSKAAKAKISEEPPKKTKLEKVSRKTAPAEPAADKPVKWWLKPKQAKPPTGKNRARRKRG